MSTSVAPDISIILPIIDRHDTFERAISVGLTQTHENFELLLALSDATAQVRDTAQKWAKKDTRIRIFETGPSPGGRTGVARHQAVLNARSDKILVLQDDDHWGAEHAGYMLSLLENADVAFNRVAAVTLSGTQMAWHPALHLPAVRSLSQTAGLKFWYEAHYAFRRSAYLRMGVPWDTCEVDLSTTFHNAALQAQDSLRWAGGSEITSWSFNSPPRSNPGGRMSIPARARELTQWSMMLEQGAAPSVSWIERFFRVCVTPDVQALDYRELVQMLGLWELGLRQGSAQDKELRTVFDALRREAVEDQALIDLLANLLEGGQNYCYNYPAAMRVLNAAGRGVDAKTAIALAAAQKAVGLKRACCLAFAAQVALSSGNVAIADTYWRDAQAVDERIDWFAAQTACQIAKAQGDRERYTALIAPFEAEAAKHPWVAQIKAAD